MIDTIAQPSDISDPHKEPTWDAPSGASLPPKSDLVETDLLVEDVSIDGMCGVY
jgi:mycofactocin precursor